MMGPMLAQAAWGGKNWFVIFMGCWCCFFSATLLVQAFVPAQRERQGRKPRSAAQAWFGAVVFASLGYFFLGGQFGWPVPGAGLVIVQQLFARAALLALLVMGWVVIGPLLAITGVVAAPELKRFEGPQLADVLDPDETVHWQGRADHRLFASEAWAAFLLGVILLFPGCAGIGLTIFGVGQEGLNPMFVIPLCAGFGFFFIAAYLMATPWRNKRLFAQSEYAVTDRRAIVLRPPGWNPQWYFSTVTEPCYIFDDAAIRQRQLKRQSRRRTDVVFLQELHAGRRRSHYVPIGFLGVAEWEQVDQLLQRRFDNVPVLAAGVMP